MYRRFNIPSRSPFQALPRTDNELIGAAGDFAFSGTWAATPCAARNIARAAMEIGSKLRFVMLCSSYDLFQSTSARKPDFLSLPSRRFQRHSIQLPSLQI